MDEREKRIVELFTQTLTKTDGNAGVAVYYLCSVIVDNDLDASLPKLLSRERMDHFWESNAGMIRRN